jgi:hypothetical protein
VYTYFTMNHQESISSHLRQMLEAAQRDAQIGLEVFTPGYLQQLGYSQELATALAAQAKACLEPDGPPEYGFAHVRIWDSDKKTREIGKLYQLLVPDDVQIPQMPPGLGGVIGIIDASRVTDSVMLGEVLYPAMVDAPDRLSVAGSGEVSLTHNLHQIGGQFTENIGAATITEATGYQVEAVVTMQRNGGSGMDIFRILPGKIPVGDTIYSIIGMQITRPETSAASSPAFAAASMPELA